MTDEVAKELSMSVKHVLKILILPWNSSDMIYLDFHFAFLIFFE